jgi:hypothetical protein
MQDKKQGSQQREENADRLGLREGGGKEVLWPLQLGNGVILGF